MVSQGNTICLLFALLFNKCGNSAFVFTQDIKSQYFQYATLQYLALHLILKLLTRDIFLDFDYETFFLSCFQGMSDLLFLSSDLIMPDAIKLV